MMPRMVVFVSMVAIGLLVLPLSSSSWGTPPSGGITIPVPENAKQQVKPSPIIEEDEGEIRVFPPGLQRLVFIHYKKGFGKPDWAGASKKSRSKCYGTLAKGSQWVSLPTGVVINPSGVALSEDFVRESIEKAACEWDAYTSTDLLGCETVPISTIDYDASIDWDVHSIDFTNELVFGDYPEPGVIAVTVAWGYFSGPPALREITEFDILFDTDYVWGDASESQSVMDLQNIATHEIGHGLGLGDLYDQACDLETMYGYSTNGETIKRNLNDGDVAGIQELYGN